VEPDSSPQNLLEQLSPEVLLTVFQYLASPDLCVLGATCHYLHSVTSDPWVWREKLLTEFGECPGVEGVDTVKKQEDELSLSQSRSKKEEVS
jgi:hypothetical protein